MRLPGVVLLGLAALCLAVAVCGSLLGPEVWLSGDHELATASVFVAIIAWVAFAACLAIGLVCSRRGTRLDRAAITIRVGALVALVDLLSLCGLVLSPAFTAALAPGGDFSWNVRLGLPACATLLLLIVPAGLHLQRVSRAPR